MHGQDTLPGPVTMIELDSSLTDPELFRQLYCQKPGVEGLGDLWLDVPGSKWWFVMVLGLRISFLYTYLYIYMWYEPRPHAHPMQANLPLCIRYLVGCKYTSLPGRWETWLSIEWKYFGRSEFEWRVGRAWCYICIPRTWSFNIFVLERISLNLGGAGHQGRFDKNCKGKQKVKGQRKLKAWTWRWLQLTLQDPHIFVFEDFAIRALYMWEAGYQGLRSMDT